MNFQVQICSFLGLSHRETAEKPVLPSSSSVYRGVREDFLKTNRLIDVVLGDGNCFFRSVAKELLGDQSHHGTVRSLLMEFLSENGPHFSGLTESFGEPFAQHCERLTTTGSWATVTELTGLAAFLHVPVYVLT